MSLTKQIGLVAAGCQPWNSDVSAACGDYFAYCATLAIYIYQIDPHSREYQLQSIQSQHKKSITAISWSPYDVNLIVSASVDGTIMVYNVTEQTVVSKLENCGDGSAPCSLAWGLPDQSGIMFISGKGPLVIWNRKEDCGRVPDMSSHPEVRGFSSNVCMMRCHPRSPERIALGHVDGSISIFGPGNKVHKHALSPEDPANTNVSVKSIEWDPLSTDYLLVATAQSTIMLVDSTTALVVMYFELPSVAAETHTLAWLPCAPGMFITGDANTGVLRLWNVSKSSPVENLRLKKTGFKTLLVLPTRARPVNTNDNNSTRDPDDEQTEDMVGQQPSCTSFTVPSARILCTFLDGGVGVYNLRKRKWIFLREMGHIETIFDCQFHPDDADVLATGSFDGTIKVWDVSTLKPTFTSAGNEGIIYSLSWSPSDLRCIAASTAKDGIFVMNIDSGRVTHRFKEHGDAHVYTVAWNLKDGHRIASAGGDNLCIIRQLDGKVLMKYHHPAPVYGCDWSPHNSDIIATGCGDKIVRVFYLATNNDKELKKFCGHLAKVFRVKWCPLREGILVSGSDDSTVRMWDYTQEGGCIRVFQGHTAAVRGLLWNPEIPYLLMSGSWDYSIRVWDTRDGACLDTILDHGADVYGLACHAQRPFIVASCSRDSTLRLWSTSMLVQPLEMNVLSGRPWNEIIISPERTLVPGTSPLFAGRVSRDIKLHLEGIRSVTDMRSQAIEMFSNLFANPMGSKNLWDLVHVSLELRMSDVSSGYNKGIIHKRHLTKYKEAAARELEMVKMCRYGAGLKIRSHEAQLREAADIHMKMGNVMQYCELMIKIGQWDKALIMAPAVSMDYWTKLMQRRAECLVLNDNDDSLPYCIASGNVSLAVQFLTTRGQHSDAMLVAAAADEGLIASAAISQLFSDSNINKDTKDVIESNSYLNSTSERLAAAYFRDGMPIQAACCHMAIDDHKKAMCKLIRGGELELAFGIGLALKTVPDQLRLAAVLLSRRCEKIGQWELGIGILKMVTDSETFIAQLCCRCAASMSEINSLHQLAGLPSMEDCVVKAEACETLFDRVKYYMLSSSPELGLELGLAEVKKRITQSNGVSWRYEDVIDILHMMASLQTERLIQSKCSRYLRELLTLCAYVGALAAISRHYFSIVPGLFRHAVFLMQRDPTDLPITQQLVRDELEVWLITHPYHNNAPECEPQLSSLQVNIYQQLMNKTEKDWLADIIEPGPDFVSGSKLPSHSDVNNSCLDAQRILGPCFFLEDGHSCISINDAYMWAKVNPFSPLGSGMRINPF